MSDEKKTTAAAKKAAAVQEEAVVYCGPTIKGLAPQYTVFVGGVPAKLAEKMEAIPALKALTVPREKFAEMRVKVEQDGTRENTLYQRADALLKDAVTNTAAAE
jgi:hypothetical protein